MGFNDEYLKLRKKRLEEQEKEQKNTPFVFTSGPYQNATLTEGDIAPVANTKTVKATEAEKKNEGSGLFKAGAFSDGYQFGDVTKTILGTAGDAATGIVQGIFGIGEGIADLIGYGVAGVYDLSGDPYSAEMFREIVAENQTEQLFDPFRKKTNIADTSLLGDFGYGIAQGVGQVGAVIATGGAGSAAGLGTAGTTALTTGMVGASSMGSGMSEAYQSGATDEEALAYGAMSGVIDAGTELIFGGLGKAVKAIGVSKGVSSLDDVFAKKLSEKMSKQFFKNATEFGVKATAEGLEEVMAGYLSAVAKNLTYMSEEDLQKLVEDENLLEQFAAGAIVSGIAQSGDLVKTTKQGRDFITNFSANEETVIEKVYNDRVAEAEQDGTKLTNKQKNKLYEQVQEEMRKGYISTDDIESVLGGETYKSYKETVDSEDAILKEFEELGKKQNATLADQARYAELQEKVKEIKSNSNRNNLKSQLSQTVYDSVKGKDFYLAESYHERARRGTAFEVDLSQYDGKTAETVKRAIDSGILNNTRRTHEFVDMVAKISADKGVLFDFTNNAKLKESGFAIDGKFVNGYVTKDGISVNIDSHKSLNSIVGHEISHVLEGTELYAEMQSALFEYAKSKKDYDGRRKTLEELYKNVEGAEIDAELTADLVGDYLFTDEAFINNLSTKHRNVFKKIYDEIKYLLKVATSGSKEARELEKVKRAFDKAYRANSKASGDTKYSLSDSDGKKLTKEQSEYFKDSKMRDENGNLKVMYHGSQDAGFHIFDAKMSDDDTSFFFVDRNDVAASYSGTSETYEAQTIRTAEDMNNFIESIGVEGYEVVEKDGKFTLLYEGDRVADSNTAKGIYEEFCWYEGVGEGDANYKVYLNLTNPLVIDAKGGKWNDLRHWSKSAFTKAENVEVRRVDSEFRLFDKTTNAEIANSTVAVNSYTESMDRNSLLHLMLDKANYALSINTEHLNTTRDVSKWAKAHGYDGVIFNNIHDNGGFSNGSEGASTVAIAFESNQIKSVANEKPTSNPDIRYSLSNPQTDKDYLDAVERGDTETAQKIVEDVAKESGYAVRAYHGTARGDRVGNVFLPERSTSGPMAFFTDNKDIAANYARYKADTSMAYDPDYDRYETQFRIKTKYSNQDVPLYLAWRILPLDARNRITEKAGQLREDWDGDNELILDPETNEANGGFQWQLKEARGNAIQALIEQWLNSGTLYNEEARFLDVLEKAGVTEEFKKIGMDSLYFKDPNAKHEKVYDTFLKITKPFDTSTVDEAFVDNLEAWYEEQDQTIYERESVHADIWDKNNIDAYDFAERLRNDIENGTSHAWTSIPDSVTDYLKSLGYDGIKDVGGKNGGIGHTVWIPFSSEQVKSAEPITYDNNGNVIPLSERFNANNNDIRYSLSKEGETPKRYGNYNIFGEDISLEAPTAEDVAPESEVVAKNAIPTENVAPMPSEPTIYDLEQEQAELEDKIRVAMESNDPSAPALIDQYGELLDTIAKRKKEESAMESERLASLDDADAPPEVEAPYYGESTDTAPENPFEDRDIKAVGNRKVNAYMYENPEVKPFFQAEANVMLGELQNTIKGERWYNAELHYASGGEYGWGGAKRHTTPDIAYLLDVLRFSYADIEKGLNAIIEDNGKENNAASKRIEFLLNDRLINGYRDADLGFEIPPNQDYINLLNEKQISEYSEEARAKFFEEADKYDPLAKNIAPVAENKTAQDPIIDKPIEDAPIAESAPKAEAYEAIKPKKESAEPRMKRVKEGEQTGETEPPKVAKILTEEPEVPKKMGRAFTQARANVLDKGSVVEDLSLKTGNRELQGKYNFMHYSEARAQRYIADNLKPIVDKAEQLGKTEELYEYAYHLHNIDRMSLEAKGGTNKAVFGDTITADISRETVKKLEAENPEFKELEKEIIEYNAGLRQMLVDAGIIPQETADLWAQMYPHYVPIRRLGDEGLSVNVPLDTNKTGVNAPIKRAKGGNRDIMPLFDTMAMRTEQTFKAIAKNNFGTELMHTLDTVVENESTNLDEVMDSLDNHEELLQKGKHGKNPTFTVFENGKKVTFEITEDLYDALKPTSKGLSYTNKVASTASNIFRGILTEYNPVFMASNAIKDVQDVLINSQHAAKTYANIPKAIKEMSTKGRWYAEYMENGGEQNTYFDSDSKTFKQENKGFIKTIGMPLRAISTANNFIERAPRLAEYIASREAGASVETAMLDAARVTTNFAAGGDVTKFLNRNGATFLNASVQGFNQNVRNVREAKANGLKGWVKLASKVALAGLPALLLNNLLWDDDEEYEELSEYVKDNYYVIAKTESGKFIRIPKGRMFAVIQDGFEQMGNAITGNDEVDFENFFELVISNLAPNNPLENNILAPIIQVANNKTWYGEDLVPTRLQDLPDAEQFDESTDAISKWLGEKLNISPYKLNYLFDQYSGGVGDVFLPMITPEAESGDNSFVGNITAPMKDKFSTDGVLNNKNVSDFYDTMDKLTTNAKSSKATDEDILKYKYFNTVNSKLGELYAKKREIQNGDLADNEKYEAVRELQEQINDLARESLNTYNDVYISDGYASIGDQHFRWYEPGENSESEAGWQKITDKQLEKQEAVTSYLGVDPSEYWKNKTEYDFAYEYPEKYSVAKSVGGYSAYKRYSSEMYDIKADKDEDGKSISGSRKEKVIEYVNNLDIDYGERLILFKSEYNADDTYNYEIIDYLNNRQDISYEEMVSILKELGFVVRSDGTILWD